MMKIEDMKRRKKELGYTNADVAEKSGVPLGTVQKVLSGATANPRADTMEALELVLKDRLPYDYEEKPFDSRGYVREETLDYAAVSGYSGRPSSERMDEWPHNDQARKFDRWFVKPEPSDRWPRQGEYTIEDYFDIPEDIRVELIDGFIYDMATPKLNHQIMLTHLAFQFYSCIEENRGNCEVIFAPYDVRLDKDNKTMVEPDLLILCEDWDGDARYYDGAPELVVEILSPSTRMMDCTIKLRKYMNAGVKEYWIVDIEKEKVVVYLFEEDVLPTQYSFDDKVPVGISEGKCSIDFGKIHTKLKKKTEAALV